MMNRGVICWTVCLSVFVALSSTSCATDEGINRTLGPDGAERVAPQPPGKDDHWANQDCALTASSTWSIIGDAITEGDDTVELRVECTDPVEFIDVWLDWGYAGWLTRDGDAWVGTIDVSELPPGEHSLLLAADGEVYAFAEAIFVRTHPLYVFVSNDWDRADNDDPTWVRQEELHARHPHLKLTHFVGPYTFTDPSVSPERAEALTDWVTGLQANEGDEIGLHIHGYCNFVEAAGVDCRTEPSYVYSYGDSTGYTVVMAEYTEEEFGQLLQKASELFEAHGLGTPRSFRAGGWTLGLHTLKALESNGYLADASAAHCELLEDEWGDHPGAILHDWCEENWGPIDATSQPYYPSRDGLLLDAAPHVGVLELPDNGLLVDYVTTDEMVEVFQANWDGSALERPTLVSIGYHPPNFSDDYLRRLDGALTHIDQFLAVDGHGPVVYATASELAQVWTVPVE